MYSLAFVKLPLAFSTMSHSNHDKIDGKLFQPGFMVKRWASFMAIGFFPLRTIRAGFQPIDSFLYCDLHLALWGQLKIETKLESVRTNVYKDIFTYSSSSPTHELYLQLVTMTYRKHISFFWIIIYMKTNSVLPACHAFYLMGKF